MRASIRGFHDPRASAREGGESSSRQFGANLLRELVVWMISLKPRGAENGHRGTELVQRLERAPELIIDSPEPGDFFRGRAGLIQEFTIMTSGSAAGQFV